MEGVHEVYCPVCGQKKAALTGAHYDDLNMLDGGHYRCYSCYFEFDMRFEQRMLPMIRKDMMDDLRDEHH